MSKTLSNISDIATEVQNTTGVDTPILEVQPEDGTELIIRNAVERGEQMRGIPIYAKLYDSNGNELPADTRLMLQFERPADDDATTVSEPFENTRSYRSLDVKEQQNTDYVDQVKHIIKGRGLVVTDNDTLYFSVDSSEQVDWSQAGTRVQFAEEAVIER